MGLIFEGGYFREVLLRFEMVGLIFGTEGAYFRGGLFSGFRNHITRLKSTTSSMQSQFETFKASGSLYNEVCLFLFLLALQNCKISILEKIKKFGIRRRTSLKVRHSAEL